VAEDAQQHQRHRAVEVEDAGGPGENRRGVVEVRVEVRRDALGGAGQQRAGVGEDHGVVVDVDDARLGGHAPPPVPPGGGAGIGGVRL
jgi:hypothetical protein